MVELPPEPLSHDPTDSSFMLGIAAYMIYMLYMLAFIAMMLVIIMIVNCVFNHLTRRPQNILVIVQ